VVEIKLVLTHTGGRGLTHPSIFFGKQSKSDQCGDDSDFHLLEKALFLKKCLPNFFFGKLAFFLALVFPFEIRLRYTPV